MNTLLITGAEGFTGRHLIQAAQLSGYHAQALTVDLTDAKAVMEEVAAIAPTHVVHLAAISAVTHADETGIYRVNLFGSMNLLNALAALPVAPRKILLASSANIYGNTVISPITEETCPQPVNHYAISKLAMENVAATFANKLDIVSARPFNYTGLWHDDRFVIPKMIQHFIQRREVIELGNMNVEREFNDVRMVCHTYLKLLELGEAGQAYNVCTGKPLSLQSVLDTLQHLTQHRIEVRVNPAFVRPNEIHRLCGSPAKLEACIGSLPAYSLEETLTWMLEATPST
jgi:nucleoside-diphosphate-sugar epimerase